MFNGGPDTFNGIYRTRCGAIAECKGFIGKTIETEHPVGFSFDKMGNVTHFEKNGSIYPCAVLGHHDLDLMERLSGKEAYETRSSS